MNLNMENLNSKTNKVELEERLGLTIGKEVSAVKDFKSLRGPMLQSFRDMEAAIKLNNNPIKIGNKEIRTAEGIFNAIKDGSLVGKELGRVEKGFLKSQSTSASLRKAIVVDYIKDANVLKDMSQYSNTKELRKAMTSKGYPKETIDEVILQMRSNGKIDKSGNLIISGGGKNQGKLNPPPNPKPTKTLRQRVGNKINELINGVKTQKWTWKKALVWAAGLGISASVLWWWFYDESDIIPDDIPQDCPQDGKWVQCVQSLLTSKKGKLYIGTETGKLYVHVKETGVKEYDDKGGLYFYQDMTVRLKDKSKEGTYKCGGKGIETINESILTENMASDVDRMIDLLDFPVSQQDLFDARTLLQKYYDSGQGAKFLNLYRTSGLMNASLKTSLDYIYTSKAASVEAKQDIYNLIGKIKNAGGGEKPAPVKDDVLGIQITWNSKNVVDDTDGGDKTNTGNKNPALYKKCTDFPYTFGCKSERIAEIQRCLKINDDGAFGPNTLTAINNLIDEKSKLDNTKEPNGAYVVMKNRIKSEGISREDYDWIMKNCKSENKAVIKPVDPTEKPKPQVGEPLTPTNKTEPTTATAQTQTGESPADLYARLVKGGFLRGRLKGKRIVYKGPDLSKEEQEKLTKYFSQQGYRLSRDNFDKKYGDKYVFKKNEPEENK